MTCSLCDRQRNHTAYCGQCGERIAIRASSSDALLCTLLDDRYFIESKIAAGGFGTVYRARSLASEQEVAIKILHSQHNADPSISARFRREAVAMSSLANPHTVTTYELGEDRNGTQYIVMELLRGESLAERFIACGTLHWRTVLSILRATCESLSEAHKLGIVHRDLKPANIFLSQEPTPDFVKVLDFGIAKILNGSNLQDGADLTRIGQAIGTLEYMSPEQLIGGELDKRTDIYTLGVVAYEMIAGRRPFADATGATGLVTALMTRRPAPLSTLVRTALPPALDGVLMRCLERDSQDRYASIEELATVLDRMLATKQELITTQRQWIDKTPSPIMMDDDHEEVTWIDSKPPGGFEPPMDDGPRFIASELVEPPQFAARFDDAVRTQLTSQPPIDQPDSLAPRIWRAAGTGVPGLTEAPFDLTDSHSAIAMAVSMPTGARPLIATRYQIARAGSQVDDNVPRLAVGSSPVIADAIPEPVLLPDVSRPRLGFFKVALWAIGLTAAGLGLGLGIASIVG